MDDRLSVNAAVVRSKKRDRSGNEEFVGSIEWFYFQVKRNINSLQLRIRNS